MEKDRVSLTGTHLQYYSTFVKLPVLKILHEYSRRRLTIPADVLNVLFEHGLDWNSIFSYNIEFELDEKLANSCSTAIVHERELLPYLFTKPPNVLEKLFDSLKFTEREQIMLQNRILSGNHFFSYSSKGFSAWINKTVVFDDLSIFTNEDIILGVLMSLKDNKKAPMILASCPNLKKQIRSIMEIRGLDEVPKEFLEIDYDISDLDNESEFTKLAFLSERQKRLELEKKLKELS
jgi:hypothetical protein